MKKNKELILSIIFIILIILIPNTYTNSTTTTSQDTWVKDAFNAAGSFLKEDVKDPTGGHLSKGLQIFINIVKGINTVLIVALFAISAIALAIDGIKYIMAGGSPEKVGKAKSDLVITFKGMAIGFGAYTIWRISMGVVVLIIEAFSQS